MAVDSDDEPIVILPKSPAQPRGRGRPRVRDMTPEQVRARAHAVATDHLKARKVIADVNQARMMTAMRLANLDLFPVDELTADQWRAKKRRSDLVPFQLLFELRAEFDEAKKIEDAYKRVQCRTTLLTKMMDGYMALVAEAGKASDEWRKILADDLAMAQRKQEHVEKMELERDKLASKTGSDIPEVGELQRIAQGDIT